MRSSLVPASTTIVVGLLVVACASTTTASPNTTPASGRASTGASPTPSPTAGPTGATTASPTLPPLPATASLPVRGSAGGIGVLTAPGPGGTVYVAIPRPDGSVLALLDRSGRPRPGWPITVEDSTACGLLLPVDDGSVRIVCHGTDLPQPDDPSQVRAFAFDAGGVPLAGWPVLLPFGWPAGFVGYMVGDELMHFSEQRLTVDPDSGAVSYEAWLTSVAAGGTIGSGARVARDETACCAERWAVGPDGVAYGTVQNYGDSPEAPKSSELLAVGFAGARAGFPIAIDGLASEPSFDAAGRIHITANDGPDRRARTLVFDTNGQAVLGGSDELGISASDECSAIEGSCEVPAAPLVGPDGTAFVIDNFPGTTVVGLSPSGQVMAGWPYRTQRGPSGSYCCPDDTDPVVNWASPAIGRDNVLFLLHAAATESVGGSIVAVGLDGRVRPGWPVELKRPGAQFWSAVVGSDGTAYAVAIEPESGDTSSASILAIAPDSTVRYTTTIIDP